MPVYSKTLFNRICTRIAEGESLRSVCRDPKMPSMSQVMNWLNGTVKKVGNPKPLQEQYARAMEARADALFEEIEEIADDGSNDWMERHGDDGENIGWQLNGEHVQRSKLRVDTRKWMLGKMKPKKYGDKLEVEATVGMTVNVVDNFEGDT